MTCFFTSTLPATENKEDLSTVRFYSAQPNDSIDSVAKKFFPYQGKKYENNIEQYKRDLKYINPQISNWNAIPRRSTIFLDILNPLNREQSKQQKVEVQESKVLKEVPATNILQTYTLFTLSQGNFNESILSGTGHFSNTQNSPLSLAFGANYRINGTPYLFSASAYFAYILSFKLSGDLGAGVPTSVSPPPEIGANFYFHQFVSKVNGLIFEGIDIENFCTLNTKYFALGANLTSYSNKLAFATIGFRTKIEIFKKQTVLIASFSQSVLSQTTDPTTDTFSGNKITLFASIADIRKFSYHIIYKHYSLTGPTKLTIDRIGVGMGYGFF
jgi:hypothetical protein